MGSALAERTLKSKPDETLTWVRRNGDLRAFVCDCRCSWERLGVCPTREVVAFVVPGPVSARKYDVVIDVREQTSHTRVLRLVGSGKRVLDLGCASGALAEQLTALGCQVVGVERDAEAAEAALVHCQRVVVCDLDRDDLDVLSALGEFDVVVAADVLEHLSDPGRLLQRLTTMLPEGGYLVTSIPNVAHGSVRLALLDGRFPYADLGLLDDTHLRFYTRQSMTQLLAESGFAIAYVEDQLLDPELGEVLSGVVVEDLPAEARALVRADLDSSVYQFVAVSSPAPLTEGLLSALRRASDELSEQRLLLHERHIGSSEDVTKALTLEGQMLAARRTQMLQDVKLSHAAARIGELEQHVERLTSIAIERVGLESLLRERAQTLQEIYGSKLWRVGTAYRRALTRRSRG